MLFCLWVTKLERDWIFPLCLPHEGLDFGVRYTSNDIGTNLLGDSALGWSCAFINMAWMSNAMYPFSSRKKAYDGRKMAVESSNQSERVMFGLRRGPLERDTTSKGRSRNPQQGKAQVK